MVDNILYCLVFILYCLIAFSPVLFFLSFGIKTAVSSFLFPHKLRPRGRLKLVQFSCGRFGLMGKWEFGTRYFYDVTERDVGMFQWSDPKNVIKFCVGTKQECLEARKRLYALPANNKIGFTVLDE